MSDDDHGARLASEAAGNEKAARRDSAVGAEFRWTCGSPGRGGFAAAIVQDAEYDRNEEQRSDGGADQPADHSTAKRCVLLAAFAKPKRHGRHTDDHGKRGHQNRPEPDEAGFKRGLIGITGFLKLLAGKADDQHAVGSGDAHAHDGSGQRRYRQRGVCGKQRPHDAGQRGRQGGDDDKGVAPRLEVDDDQQVNQYDGAKKSEQQATECAVHGSHLTHQYGLHTFRQVLGFGVDDLLHVCSDCAEIAPLRGAVDLHQRHDVVLRIDRRHRCPIDVGNRAERLRGCAGGRDLHVLQRVERVDPVLRRLHHDGVVHAVIGIETISRRDLSCCRQG